MMACNCVHHKEDIEQGLADFEMLRELFIDRMTKDSETHDRRRRDYNQAIFGYIDKRRTYMVWSAMDMDMVLECFDNAIKDWRRSFCDVKDFRRK